MVLLKKNQQTKKESTQLPAHTIICKSLYTKKTNVISAALLFPIVYQTPCFSKCSCDSTPNWSIKSVDFQKAKLFKSIFFFWYSGFWDCHILIIFDSHRKWIMSAMFSNYTFIMSTMLYPFTMSDTKCQTLIFCWGWYVHFTLWLSRAQPSKGKTSPVGWWQSEDVKYRIQNINTDVYLTSEWHNMHLDDHTRHEMIHHLLEKVYGVLVLESC